MCEHICAQLWVFGPLSSIGIQSCVLNLLISPALQCIALHCCTILHCTALNLVLVYCIGTTNIYVVEPYKPYRCNTIISDKNIFTEFLVMQNSATNVVENSLIFQAMNIYIVCNGRHTPHYFAFSWPYIYIEVGPTRQFSYIYERSFIPML